MAIFQQPASDHNENPLLGELTITKNEETCQSERQREKSFLRTGFARMIEGPKETFKLPFPIGTEPAVLAAILFKSLASND